MTDKYLEFIRSKVKLAARLGFDVIDSEINPMLKPHQRDIVKWMVGMGRAACFAAFGLGKSVIQLEAVRITRQKAGGMGLIVIPLGVRQEFVRDAAMLGVSVKFIRRIEEADDPDGIYLTNYETVRDGKLDPRLFSVASLDEAACLRGFGGTKTFREFMALFAGDRKTFHARTAGQAVDYRFVATATPSPNDYIELLAYSAFLGIMDVGQAKTRFFKRNSEKADELTIHPHKEREFWLWVASWGLFVQRPSDLGYSDEGYSLPEMDIHWHEIASDHTDAGFDFRGQGLLIKQQAIGIVDSAREKRESIEKRVEKVMKIVSKYRNQFSLKECNYDKDNTGAEQRILRGEQESIASGIAGTVSRQQGSQKGIHEGVSKDIYETDYISRKERCSEPKEERTLCERSRVSGEVQSECEELGEDESRTEARKQVKTRLRTGKASIRGDSFCTKRVVCDLRKGSSNECNQEQHEEDACYRSLPQNGESPRNIVQQLQPRNRSSERQPGIAPACDGLPDQIVIWCDLNNEQKSVEKSLKESGISHVSLYGNTDIEDRMILIDEWKDRKHTVFLSKPTMYGAGINLQQCHTMIFAGIGFKAADFLQAIHRIHRFLQTSVCEIHIIYTESEREVRRILESKWEKHKRTMEKMTEIIKEFGLSAAAMQQTLQRALGVERVEVIGRDYRIINNDAIIEARAMPENSLDLIVTSVPFSTQYEYSPNYSDFGHTDTNEHFFEQMDFLTPELLRALKPGRVAAIHVKDRIVPGGLTGLGYQTVYPFHAKCIDHYTRHGFGYMGMITIVTDVVRENNQTYRLGWSEVCKDGSKLSCGLPEYMLLFRKTPTDTSNAYADDPVKKTKADYSRSRWQTDAHGFWRSSGNRLMTPEELETLEHDVMFRWFRDYNLKHIYDYEHHVKIGETIDGYGRLPVTFMLLQPPSWIDDVWTDVARMRTLNTLQSQKGKEQHLCPLPFDIIDRIIKRFSNPGETVFDPFSGIGSVPYCAILNGRKGLGTELSPRYFTDAAHWCQAAEREMSVPDLFGTIDGGHSEQVVEAA